MGNSTDKIQITFSVDEKLIEQIDDYWYARRLRSRSDSIRELLEIGMNILNDKKDK